jgi:hypothetical protein
MVRTLALESRWVRPPNAVPAMRRRTDGVKRNCSGRTAKWTPLDLAQVAANLTKGSAPFLYFTGASRGSWPVGVSPT